MSDIQVSKHTSVPITEDFFAAVMEQIDNARTLDQMEAIIDSLELQRNTGKLLLAVAIYYIDARRLYRMVDCRSLSEFARRFGESFELGPTSLSKYRQIGEGFVRCRVPLTVYGVGPSDFACKLSAVPHLMSALGIHSDQKVAEAFTTMSVADFKDFARGGGRVFSSREKLADAISKEHFHGRLVPLLEEHAATEQKDDVMSAYFFDPETEQYRLDKGLTREQITQVIDAMYHIGYRNPDAYQLTNWMETAVQTTFTNAPLQNRSPRILFSDDPGVPPKVQLSTILERVRERIEES